MGELNTVIPFLWNAPKIKRKCHFGGGEVGRIMFIFHRPSLSTQETGNLFSFLSSSICIVLEDCTFEAFLFLISPFYTSFFEVQGETRNSEHSSSLMSHKKKPLITKIGKSCDEKAKWVIQYHMRFLLDKLKHTYHFSFQQKEKKKKL